MFRRYTPRGRKRQSGVTLVELMVAGAISIVASGGMLALMASTLGTGTQTIKMTRLSHEMRTAMLIMARELRRANYHADFADCFGNENCIADADISAYVKSISIHGGTTGSCFWFWYDRSPTSSFGTTDSVDEPVAGFRRVTNAAGVGVFQMTSIRAAAPNCDAAVTDTSWTDITDSNMYDISNFEISSDGLDVDGDGIIDVVGSYTQTFNSAGASLAVNRIRITMTGRLVSDASLPDWMEGEGVPTLTLQDFIRVRNDIPSP